MIEKIDEKESNLVINLVNDTDYVELSSLSAINEDEFYIVSKDNTQNSFNRGTETLCKFISEATISAATSTTFGGIKADPATANETVEAKIGNDGKLYTAVPTYDLSPYMKKDGSVAMTGNLNMNNKHINNANYIYANWYAINSSIGTNTPATEILVKQNGWIYSRTPAQIRSDIDAQQASTLSVVPMTIVFDDDTTQTLKLIVEKQ